MHLFSLLSFPCTGQPGTDFRITGKEFRVPELLQRALDNMVEERSKILSAELQAAPQHKPGPERQVLESTMREEGLDTHVPMDPGAELPAPNRRPARHPTSANPT